MMTTTAIPSKYPKEEYMYPSPEGHGACLGCSLPIVLRCILKVLGDKLVLIALPGCTSNMLNSPRYLLAHNGWCIQEYSVPFGSAAACAAGVKAALIARGDTETQVMPFTGDGATFDIGLQTLSASAERNDDIIYVCCDNEAYENTGNQRSSATPLHGITTTTPFPATKAEPKKDIMLIMAAHGIPYAASSTVAYPDDIIAKVQKAKNIKGFRFFHFLTPCVAGWGIRSEQTVKVSRLAVETKVFPLLEVRGGTDFTITKEPKGLPVAEYVKTQGRYRHFTPEQIAQLQETVDRRWDYLKRLAACGNQAGTGKAKTGRQRKGR